MRWKVQVERTVLETTWVEVNARTRAEAARKAVIAPGPWEREEGQAEAIGTYPRDGKQARRGSDVAPISVAGA